MDSRKKVCRSKCEECPFASCNFNPAFVNIVIADKRAEATRNDFTWVGRGMAYADAGYTPGSKPNPGRDER
ncbi:MAG: hypothetical protein A2V52_04980 [Actinobacteria bacterium RBG_19FT_COMBO_54_7]|nr:MAG: hypothetical protein A2V52_04980 [Actinobacteria bacterium RBG_19FT_COMBO_54_7]